MRKVSAKVLQQRLERAKARIAAMVCERRKLRRHVQILRSAYLDLKAKGAAE